MCVVYTLDIIFQTLELADILHKIKWSSLVFNNLSLYFGLPSDDKFFLFSGFRNSNAANDPNAIQIIAIPPNVAIKPLFLEKINSQLPALA